MSNNWEDQKTARVRRAISRSEMAARKPTPPPHIVGRGAQNHAFSIEAEAKTVALIPVSKNAEATARFIVQACNNFKPLLERLNEIRYAALDSVHITGGSEERLKQIANIVNEVVSEAERRE